MPVANVIIKEQGTKLIDQDTLRSENASLRQQLEEANRQLSAGKESASEASKWKHKYEELEGKYEQNINETVAKKEQENKSQLNEKIRFYKER